MRKAINTKKKYVMMLIRIVQNDVSDMEKKQRETGELFLRGKLSFVSACGN